VATNCQYISVHPDNPQERLLKQVVDILENDGVIAYPTESGYALGCLLDNKKGADRIRTIRQLSVNHEFTLVCQDFKNLSQFAKVGNSAFRYMKSHLPGPYTFVLTASREVPRRLQAPKRKTIGLRITPNIVANALLSYIDHPMLSTTLMMPNDEHPLTDAWEIYETLGHALDAVLDGGFGGFEPTTVIDFTDEEPVLIRKGQGAFLGGE
jgi:tRNA threonylcarbamoyl adenosine modification protein (Sua5/YciO/YrdC/YwlC family)